MPRFALRQRLLPWHTNKILIMGQYGLLAARFAAICAVAESYISAGNPGQPSIFHSFTEAQRAEKIPGRVFRLTGSLKSDSRISSTGSGYFTVSTNTPIMGINSHFPCCDRKIRFFIIVAYRGALPDRILRIIPIVKGNLRIIMHKSFC